MKQVRFPIVSDDEIMLTEMPFMDLYDESDLISNIKGDYQDKNYLEWSPITTEKKPLVQASDKLPEKKEKSYAELAREEARADLKRKRSAKYLTQDVSFTKRYKPSNNVVRQANQPTAPFQKENPGEFAKFSKKLAQEHYILADSTSQKPTVTDAETTVPKKNNYDFLKKSQIYNKKSKQKEQERQVAQELNLTRMSE
ncbi:cystathionine gamma-synthase [Streptococcus infantis]|uniref:cystathionine gamma-synthase n=1 Tax=Streptococcus infantis TaxID=68892 RepID=UPI0039C1B8C9